MQKTEPKVPPLSWALSLAAIALGLVVVCMIGAVLAFLIGTGGSSAGSQSQVSPAFVPAGNPTPTGVAMQASSEQTVDAFGGIPLPAGVRSQQAVGSEQVFSVIVQQPFDRVVAFYQSTMPEWNWQPVEPEALTADRMVELRYAKDDLTAVVLINRLPFVGTLVAVTITQG